MSHKTLAAALCAIMTEVRNVEKGGKNTFHGYSYASEADLLFALQPACAKHGVAILPIHQDVKVEPWADTRKGAKQWLTTIVAKYLIVHADSGEKYEVSSVGSGIDGEDKGAYKAQTGALKYLLRQLFLVPTGTDPDADNEPASRPETTAKSEPVAKQVHPLWTREEQNGFMENLKSNGATMEILEALLKSQGWEHPSIIGAERRAKLLTYLRSPAGQAKISEHTSESDPVDMP